MDTIVLTTGALFLLAGTEMSRYYELEFVPEFVPNQLLKCSTNICMDLLFVVDEARD